MKIWLVQQQQQPSCRSNVVYCNDLPVNWSTVAWYVAAIFNRQNCQCQLCQLLLLSVSTACTQPSTLELKQTGVQEHKRTEPGAPCITTHDPDHSPSTCRSMTEQEQLIANQADLEAFVRSVSQAGPSSTLAAPSSSSCFSSCSSCSCAFKGNHVRSLPPCRQPAGGRQVTDRLKGVLAETAVTGVIRWGLLVWLNMARWHIVCTAAAVRTPSSVKKCSYCFWLPAGSRQLPAEGANKSDCVRSFCCESSTARALGV
jgi:hypothetical protein